MPRWCNGSHAGLRSQCRDACRFESDLGHQNLLGKMKEQSWTRGLKNEVGVSGSLTKFIAG